MSRIVDTARVREEIVSGRVESGLDQLSIYNTNDDKVLAYLKRSGSSTGERDAYVVSRGGRCKCVMDRWNHG